MAGKPDFLPFFKFDVTDLKVVESATEPPALQPDTIIPRDKEFKIMTDFEFRGFLSIPFLWLADLFNAKCIIRLYFESFGAGPEGEFLPNHPVKLVACKRHYSTPETDYLVANGLSEPGTYKLTCTVTLKNLPIAAFVEGPLIQIT